MKSINRIAPVRTAVVRWDGEGTLHMVKSLELKDQTPLNPANRINNFME